MAHFEMAWTGTDGVAIWGQGWSPDGFPKAAVCLVHGLAEHCGRYGHVAAALNAAGYAMLATDLRGHGRSGGQRGNSPSIEAFMGEIDGLLGSAAERMPNMPLFLYGHSLGGILALNWALRRTDALPSAWPTVRGVVVTGVGLRTALEKQTTKVMMVRVLGLLAPAMALASGLDPNTISRNREVVQAYIEDPLVHNRITLGMARQLLGAIRFAFDHAAEFPLPLLMMHGTGDMLSLCSGTEEFAAGVGGDCTVRLWDDLYHEVHNEPEQQAVLSYFIDWLDAHVSGA